MDTREQLKLQLLDIAFNGNYNAFKQRQDKFEKDLTYNDLHLAKFRCSCRLLALQNLSDMHNKPHIKNLVDVMQKELQSYKFGIFAYLAEAEKQYKIKEQEDAFGIAANIVRLIEQYKINFTGEYLINLQQRLTQEQRPIEFLEKEMNNTTQLSNSLKTILENKFQPAQALEYEAEYDVYFQQLPGREYQH